MGDLAGALGRIPSGLFIVTTGRGEEATGFLASFLQQCAFAPPTVVMAVKGERPIVPLLRQTGWFCVSIIPEGNSELLRHFAKGFTPGAKPLAGLKTADSAQGVPYLLECPAHLVCRLGSELPIGDHVLFCGEAVDGEVRGAERPWIHLRKNGLNY